MHLFSRILIWLKLIYLLPTWSLKCLILSFNNINKVEKALSLTYLTFKSNFVKQFTRWKKCLLCILRSTWLYCYRIIMVITVYLKLHFYFLFHILFSISFLFLFHWNRRLGQRPFNLCFLCDAIVNGTEANIILNKMNYKHYLLCGLEDLNLLLRLLLVCRAFYVSGVVLTLHILAHLIITKTLWSRYYQSFPPLLQMRKLRHSEVKVPQATELVSVRVVASNTGSLASRGMHKTLLFIFNT